MSKKLLEDMVRYAPRGIKKIPKEKGKKFEERFEEKEVKKIPEIPEVGVVYNKKRSRFMLWFIALVSVVVCFFAVSFLFSKAEVRVEPKLQDLVLNENLSADKDSSGIGLSFDLVVIDGFENKTITATGTKEVNENATGTVVLYNDFGSTPQALSIDTRLEGSNGKIYKTQNKITVPGKTKTGTPGSVEVKIYGSVAGPEYNSSPLDFKILGFKGTPKYTKFYGRSKGEITGGFVGTIPAVADTEKAIALSDLKNALQAKLLKNATDQIPSGFILFKKATFINIDDTNVSLVTKDNNLVMTLNGTLYGLLFNEQKLTKKIAEDNIVKYDGSDVYIPQIRDLVFTLTNKDSVSLAEAKNIDFNLSASVQIFYKLDVEKFINDLLGKPKKDFNQILSQYVNIDSATLSLSPIWKMSIPNKIKDIKVIVNYPK